MNSAVIYFSGTGNTHFIAQKIKALREGAGETVSMIPYESISDRDIQTIERIYLGFPVYGLSVPPFFKKRILELSLEGKEVYLFATMAYAGQAALAQMNLSLTRKSAQVIGGRVIKMPGSDGLAMLKPDSATLKKMVDRDFDSIPEMDAIETDFLRIDQGELDVPRNSPVNSSALIVLFSQIGEKIMAPMERWLAKKFIADDRCTGCTLCEKICPVGNITVNQSEKQVTFDSRCVLCMRCVHNCPPQAINIGKMTLNKYRYPGPGEKRFKPLKMIHSGK